MAWKKGQSGNPGGRPKAAFLVRDIAREHTELAIKTLVSICKGRKIDPRAKVQAASALLDRGWGKPVQEITGAGGAPLFADLHQMSDEELLAQAAELVQREMGKARGEA